ncbi:unnamed protein product [Bursaphelenchus okinawaensis]|uniref:HEAT repeat-containing protein 5B n=1 Tax=Bursaphelenchus okinawaensis TaxID=465554 RepID=A0A811LDZ5_9BILA|nr:unnamed protein product [Bursaphelenchus okinawaensis]CAG9121306.1 unnamed protein product [Bursaphelenchus okinawaensis]
MEQSNSLLLNEQALKECPDQNKPIFFYEWLRYLDKILPVTQKADLKSVQQKLVELLTQRISTGLGPPTRSLLAKCLTQVFSIADSYDLFQTINLCNDTFKVKDDSNAQLQVKLTALAVLGQFYTSLGKMVGRSYEESFGLLAKWIKSADSASRTEILLTLSKMVYGLGPSAHSIHKDLYKLLTKGYLTDRVMFVRVAAVKCLSGLVSDQTSPIYNSDVDSVLTVTLKSLDEANFEVRSEVAKVFAQIADYTVGKKPQRMLQDKTAQSQPKQMTFEEVLNFLSNGFIRGGIGGFLKTGNSSSTGQRQIRVGVTLAYVEVCRELGTNWLERNLMFWQKHILQMAYKIGPVASNTNHAQSSEAVHMRKCVSYIFRQTLGSMLSESGQITACKNFGQLLNEYNKFLEIPDDEEKVLKEDGTAIAIVSTVILLEMSALIQQVDTAIAGALTEANGIQENIFGCLLHPFKIVRLSAAFCLRTAVKAVPHLATPLIDRCLARLEHLRNSSIAVSGYSACIGALCAGSLHTELGIPFQKVKIVFQTAEDLIKTAAQSSKLALDKTQAGWLLTTALISMGTPYIKHNLNRLIMLWKCSFPRSVEEAKGEKGRGDTFIWECILESRAGALASMEAFVVHCQDLLTEDITKRIVHCVETTLTTMALVTDLLGSHGVRLRTPIYLVRIRLYSLLKFLSFKTYEHLFNSLLRELVADITLSDNAQAITAVSDLADKCTAVHDCLLGGWLRNSTHAELELQLHPAQTSATGSIDYDPLCIVMGSESWAKAQEEAELDSPRWPQPLPPQLVSLDAAVSMFGRIYPLVPSRHKLQLTNHFINCMANLRQTPRLQAIQLNILGALLSGMKAMSELRNYRPQGTEHQDQTVKLLRQFVTADNPLQRCLAIEALGRMSQAISEPKFFAGLAQSSFNDLQAMKDEKSRSGLALSLGALHRYVGSLGSGHHLHTAVSLVLSLAQDHSSITSRAWALLSLSLIASTGGGMFRGYVEPSLAMCIRLLLTTPQTNVEVIQCIGKLVSTLITAVGPELTSTDASMEKMRSSFIVACSMMFEHSDAQIKAEAIACQQQLHLFAPRFVELDRLVGTICHQLYSPHFILRKAAINCLKQLLQREAKEVRERAQSLIPAGIIDQSKLKDCPLPDSGLEGALFDLLDIESDPEQRDNIMECVLFLVQHSASEMLQFWLQMCKDILASSNSENVRSTLVIKEDGKEKGEEVVADDDDTLQGVQLGDTKVRDKVAPRWPTRVFAFSIVRKLMSLCETERAHLDLALAKELQPSSTQDYLVLHLADLVRMSFMGATSEISELRLAGLACLHDVIDRFAKVPEPEFPGHVILEQFQAQVGAALRPAFEAQTPSHVTAAACQVCSAWIGSGVARDLNDLRRVHQLLVSSLDKLKNGSENAQLFNESAATLEKLSILKAWAEVYIVAIQDEQQEKEENCTESLLSLVNPELQVLLGHWLGALRDSALLSLPAEFGDQLPPNGGSFYTPDSAETCKEYYRQCWPPILLASSIWLKQNDHAKIECDPLLGLEKKEKRFYLMLGMCVEALCNTRQFSDNERTIYLGLETLKNLIDSPWAQLEFMKDVKMSIEVMNVLHRLILTRDSLTVQKHCTDVVEKVVQAAQSALKEKNPENSDEYFDGFDSASGKIKHTTSLTFATLEVCLCVLVRQIPQINSELTKGRQPIHHRKYSRLPYESAELIKKAIDLLNEVPSLSSERGSLVVLPSIFYLILAILRESSRLDPEFNDITPGDLTVGAAGAIKALKQLVSQPPTNEALLDQWASIVRSALLSLLKMGDDVEHKVDDSVIMLASCVIITSTPKNFEIGLQLFYRICEVVKKCLKSKHFQVQFKALQTVNSLFQRKETAAAYVKELGPAVFNKIKPYLMDEGMVIADENGKTHKPASETDLPVLTELSDSELLTIQETIKAVESVLAMSKGEKTFMFVNLLVRCLVRFLCPDPENQLKSVPENVKKLHDFAYQRLHMIGPKYPEPFKGLIQHCAPVKQRIEAAASVIQRQFEAQKQAQLEQQQKAKAAHLAALQAANQKPTIELKMDFGGFK